MNRIPATARLWIPLSLLFPFAVSAGPVCGDEVRATQGGFSSHWTPTEWTITNSYHDIRDYAQRPGGATLSPLTVEWDRPEMDALGNFCTIRGQLKTAGDAANPTKPIDWFQGVTVYMAIAPGTKPNWSKGMDQADTIEGNEVTNPSGRFQVRIDLRKARRDRMQNQPFQFGVALAEHTVTNKTTQRVVWNSRSPAIASSVQMLRVPAAPSLARELDLINRASGWPFANSNGVALIRAVNALQPLGKDKALAVLEKYNELTAGFEYFGDKEVIFWIIRLLFEPIRLDDRIPPPANGVYLDERQSRDAMKWPLNPIAVADDVPFMVGRQIDISGRPEQPASHIRWARLHGVIRDAPLRPTTNPLAAAEAILQSRRFQALEQFVRDSAISGLRSQALAMVEGGDKPGKARDGLSNDEWKTHLKAAAERGIHWDAKREMFVPRE